MSAKEAKGSGTVNTIIDIKREDYINYVKSLNQVEVKQHFAEQFINGHTKIDKIEKSISVINVILAEIRDAHKPEKIYMQYKANKKQYKEEIEDKIIRKASYFESIKSLVILGIGVTGYTLYLIGILWK